MDDDGAGRFARRIDDDLAAELGFDLQVWHFRHHEAAVGQRGVHHVRAGDVLVDADARNGPVGADRACGDVVQAERRHVHGRLRAAAEPDERDGAHAGQHGPSRKHIHIGREARRLFPVRRNCQIPYPKQAPRLTPQPNDADFQQSWLINGEEGFSPFPATGGRRPNPSLHPRAERDLSFSLREEIPCLSRTGRPLPPHPRSFS